MARTKSTKTETKMTLEDLHDIVKRNQDQLQDLAGQMNALEMRLEDLLDELGEMRNLKPQRENLLRSEPDLAETENISGHEANVINVTKQDGVYTFKFRSFNFFRWVGVLTIGAVIGIFIMGIFG